MAKPPIPRPDYSRAGTNRDRPARLPIEGHVLRRAIAKAGFATDVDVDAVTADVATIQADLDTAEASIVDIETDLPSFQPIAEKGVADGYAELDGTGVVPIAQLATGTPTGSKFVRDDNTLATPPGGAGASATTVEIDLGATARCEGRFTITDAAIEATSKVICWQAPGPYTGKGMRADEAAMQQIAVVAVNPAAGSATVYWQTPPMVTREPAPTTGFVNGMKDPHAAAGGSVRRLGKVRGNVKFSYVVFS